MLLKEITKKCQERPKIIKTHGSLIIKTKWNATRKINNKNTDREIIIKIIKTKKSKGEVSI